MNRIPTTDRIDFRNEFNRPTSNSSRATFAGRLALLAVGVARFHLSTAVRDVSFVARRDRFTANLCDVPPRHGER